MLVKSYYPFMLTIDGDEVVLRLKRLTVDEWSWFKHTRDHVRQPVILRYVSRGPDQQATDAEGRYLVSLEALFGKAVTKPGPTSKAVVFYPPAGRAQLMRRNARDRRHVAQLSVSHVGKLRLPRVVRQHVGLHAVFEDRRLVVVIQTLVHALPLGPQAVRDLLI